MSQFSGPLGILGEIPFSTDSTASTNTLGVVLPADNNRRFVYVKNGATAITVRGTMYQGPAQDTAHQDLAVAAAAIGDKTIVTTTTVTVTANQYAGGFAVISVTPGVGQYFKIKSHAAATGAVVTLNLEDPIKVALTTASRVDLVPNVYNGVVVAPATLTGTVVGVVVNPIAANSYGWLQNWGPAPVIADVGGALTVDDAISASNQTAGTVEVGVAGQPNLGYAMSGVAAGETGLAFLRIG